MPPRPPRWLRPARAFALTFVASGLGCGAPPAQTFAVVLAEPREIHCVPTILAGGVDAASLVQLSSTIPSGWHDAYDLGQLRRQGGALHVSDDGEQALAWFDSFTQYPYAAWNALLLAGDHHDAYLELEAHTTYVDFSGNDQPDPECPPQPQSQSELLATIDGNALSGRLRAVVYYYLYTPESPCAAHVTCARNIALTGSLEP